MAAWSGFTDDDLRKMRKSSQEDEGRPRVKKVARQPRAKAQSRPKIDKSPESQAGVNSHNLPSEARLSKVEDHHEDAGGKKDERQIEVNHDAGEGKRSDGNVEFQTQANKVETKEVKELDEEEGKSVELENAVKFQQQQKVIEEANKQKRALLSRAIEERRKKAKAESAKLVKIQKELAHLDSLLTADVGIIRDKIEIASLDYVQAQKRYEKAEKEFVEAKMDLFEKGENKERLTEHLYTIIHQNEMRKAKKLVELMEQLAMEVTAEEMEMSLPTIPPLTNFNAVTTLHQPGRRESESDEKNEHKTEDQVTPSEKDPTGSQPINGSSSIEPAISSGEKAESSMSPDAPTAAETQPNNNKSDLPAEQRIDDKRSSSKEDQTDANQNNVIGEMSQNGANQTTCENEQINTIKADQTSGQVSQVSENSTAVSSDSSVSTSTSPSTSNATSSTAETADNNQVSSSSSPEQSKPPKEEKPTKGWSLPFM